MRVHSLTGSRLRGLLLIAVVFASIACLSLVPAAKPQYSGTIHIYADGSVSGTDLIQHSGNIYRLTGNLQAQEIVVECGGIILDGMGFTLEGTGSWPTPPAINLTASDVTVKSFNIIGWEVGILGAYNGNIICSNNVTRCERCIAIYADDYNVYRNYVSGWNVGIRVQGNNSKFFQNEVVGNPKGFFITNSTGISINKNRIERNTLALSIDSDCVFVYHNNFISQNNASEGVVYASVLLAGGNLTVGNQTLIPWDGGFPAGGNYWSDYTERYPNATKVGTYHIGDTPYVVSDSPHVSDRYPLLEPADISQPDVFLPFPTPTASPTPPPTPEPTPTQTPIPTTSPSPEASAAPSTSPSPTENATETPTPTPTEPPNMPSNSPSATPSTQQEAPLFTQNAIYIALIAAVTIAVAAVFLLQRRTKQRHWQFSDPENNGYT